MHRNRFDAGCCIRWLKDEIAFANPAQISDGVPDHLCCDHQRALFVMVSCPCRAAIAARKLDDLDKAIVIVSDSIYCLIRHGVRVINRFHNLLVP